MSDSATLELPCLGRPFQLGMLYDCRRDALVPGITLWDEKQLNVASSEPQPNSNFEIIAEDSIKDKMLSLGVEGSLSLSLVGGLVSVSGSAKFVHDRKSSKNTARVTLKYNCTSKFQQLTMEKLATTNIRYPDVFDKGAATHVVTAVLYGAEAFFIFDREVSQGEKYHDIHGQMEALIKAMPTYVDIGGSADVGIKKAEKTETEKFQCKFYGDVILDKNPATFQQAVEVYQQLPKHFKSTTVPKKVWLYPLSALNSKAARMVKEISTSLVIQTQQIIEGFHVVQMRSADLSKSRVCEYFTSFREQLSKFQEMVNEYKIDFMKKLCNVLPNIRGGGTEERDLADLIAGSMQSSPFEQSLLFAWLNHKEGEFKVLSQYLSMMEKVNGVTLAFVPGDLDSAITNTEYDYVLSFEFKVAKKMDSFLQSMYSMLRTKASASGNFQNNFSNQWFKPGAIIKDLRIKAKQFKSFAEGNKNNKNIKFIITDTSDDDSSAIKSAAAIVLYENGTRAEFEFEPPSQPREKPIAIGISHEKIHLTWKQPEFGTNSIKHYTVLYCTITSDKEWKEQKTEKAVTSITIHQLAPETKYIFKVRAECDCGFSQESEDSDPIETKPPPHDEQEFGLDPKYWREHLENLGFLQYYPQKLTLQDALAIDRHGLATKTTTYDPCELLPIMLEKMKMSNYNCRKVLLYGKKKDKDNMNKVGVVDDDSDDDCDGESEEDNENADDSDDNDDNVNSTEEYEIVVHPMDGLLTLIHCANNFLRQDIYVKLKTSQLAVPLLLPDPVSGTITFPLWALRSIVRNWKVKTSPSSSVSHEGRVVDCEIPLISFFRFSHPGSYSKSQILNKVIGDSKNTCFFNYECDGSSTKRQFVDGLVEANWYLPSGEDSDLFKDVITFVNLRGNACKHEQQLAFLSACSCMNFIFLKKEDIKTYKKEISHLKSAESKVVFLIKNCPKKKQSRLKKLVPHCDIVSLSEQKEPAAIVKCIQDKITKLLASSKPKQVFRLSEIEFDGFDIITDEKNVKSCQHAKKLALEIMETIKSIPISEVKNQMVPLQGYDLWRTWAAINKTQNRMRPADLGNMGLEKFQESERKEKESIRREQLKKANKCSPVMSVFINVLLNESTEVRAYFLEWLKMYLDDHSRKVLPQVQQKCKHLREMLCKATSEEEAKKIREDLVKQDKALIDASFGVEHFFCELAQIYECTMELQSEVKASKLRETKMFPEVAAELLLKGYPLEIIDGDAAHIPMKWIKAVLESIKGHIKNSKMFVLSVLGIRSTGKSTLMNTLFGAHFAVSAGRCTRGAYFQLMKLNSNKAECDYMLIIDTEGLRAPELDSQHTQQHDNELATLVIGLAGATIINIFGEVPADINDILQTSVHAFLRMKQVDLKPSCQFVRHHVSNVSASKANEGSQRFQKTLDDMTVWAAKAEHCVGKYTQFSDVISFSNETDVQNFPSLWEGNPPMAPVNPAYCEAAQKLKSKFIEMSMSSGTLCTVDEFKRRVTTLWEAIIKENYVFSFKNTLEVEAYTVVDAEYSKWKWNLQNHMLEEESKAKNKITSSSDADVHSIENNLVMKFIDSLESEFDKTMEAAKKFFENPNSSLAPIMVQWQGRYEAKLNNLKEDNKGKFKMFCSDLIQKRHDKTKLDELKGSLRSDINEQIKDLVSKMNIDKDKGLTEEELSTAERKFNQKWDKWMSDVGKKHSPFKRKDLDTLILICIKSDCQLDKYDKLINSELTKLSLQDRGQPLQLVIDQNRHLQFGIVNRAKRTESGFQKDVKKARDMTSKLVI